MGFLDKVKNLFTEEEEVFVEPVKKEVIQVEIPAPAEEKKEQLVAERKEVIKEEAEEKKEEKNPFPVFFDDKDFESLERPKIEKKKEKKKVSIPKKEEAYQARTTTYEEKKVFKPSPIISPVYGILDKNYKKDELTDRQVYTDDFGRKPHKMDIDDVRNKAFGTLEDDIDTVFTEDDITTMSRETYHSQNADLEEDLMDTLGYEENTKDVDLFETEPEKTTENDDFDMLDDFEDKEEDNMVVAAMDEKDDADEDLNLNESDLFNLIDSMYEKRDEEE